MKKLSLLVLSVGFLVSRSLEGAQYGQVVRIQCERTGQYLAFDPAVDENGEYKVILQDDANDDTLWIVKGPLSAPVSETNPYDRWNCVFGQDTPTSSYDMRLEHVILAYDAHFGDYLPDLTGHTNPYTFKLGTNKLTHSDAFHFYNVVLNLHGEKKIIISNEYVCADDSGDAILTQDATVDTWNIIPVYMMTDDLRTVEGQDLIDALKGTGGPEGHDENAPVADCLIEDVTALIDFYNNEITYREAIRATLDAIAAETDINNRISILEGLEPSTTSYHDQLTMTFGNIVHPDVPELTTCINDMLIQNQTKTMDLETQKMNLENDNQILNDQLATTNADLTAATDELATVSADLSAVGATTVPDLASKVNQLLTMLASL